MWEWIIASAIAHRAVNRSGGARYLAARLKTIRVEEIPRLGIKLAKR